MCTDSSAFKPQAILLQLNFLLADVISELLYGCAAWNMSLAYIMLRSESGEGEKFMDVMRYGITVMKSSRGRTEP